MGSATTAKGELEIIDLNNTLNRFKLVVRNYWLISSPKYKDVIKQNFNFLPFLAKINFSDHVVKKFQHTNLSNCVTVFLVDAKMSVLFVDVSRAKSLKKSTHWPQ